MRWLVIVFCAGALGAQDTAIFRGGVSLVHIDAEVMHDGRAIGGLSKDDFLVKDEGAPQAILQFSAGEQPLDLILLFDISGSMQDTVSQVAAAARRAFQELRQGDRVAIMVFNFRSRVILPFSDDLDRVSRAIREDVLHLKFGGGTLIQNAMANAARQFMSEPRNEHRRAVLIITDNEGQRTRSTSSVARDFWEADAILSGLIVRGGLAKFLHAATPVMAPHMALLRVGIGGVADKTGGDAIRADDPGEGFREMIRRIRTRYSLYYALPAAKPGSVRTVRVELAGDATATYPKARVRARAGYRVPAADVTPKAKKP